MNIYNVRDLLRQWFHSQGIVECPEFPAALSDGWHHPDVLLSILGGEATSFCVFQTISEKAFCNIAPLKNSPGLVWVVKPFDVQFLEIFGNFLTELEQNLYQGPTQQRFAIKGDSAQKGDLLERSCSYKVIFNGIETGECRVFSSILGEKLKESVAVVTMNVGRVLRSMSKEQAKSEPDWLENRKLSQFSAFQAFPGPKYNASRSSDFLIHEIERIEKKHVDSAFARLNDLIMLYNSSRGTFFENQKLCENFCNALKKIKETVFKASENTASKAGK